VVCDVTKRGDIENLREQALAKFGRIDIWVNNAGQGISEKALDLTEEQFDQVIDVNLKSAWYGMQAIVPYFQKEKRGQVINISSFLGKVPVVSFRSIYSASKAALNLLTANVRMDLAAEYPDIHVSLVMPGPVSTDFAKNVVDAKPSAKPMVSPMQAQTADEVAEVIIDVINNPRPEVFTHPDLYQRTVQYYTDVAAFEKLVREMGK
jgi:short-subunit dehydrogenase